MKKPRGVSFPRLELNKLSRTGGWDNTKFFVNGKEVSCSEFDKVEADNNRIEANHRIKTKKVVAKMVSYLVHDKDVNEFTLLKELLAKKGVDNNTEVDRIINELYDSVHQYVNRERIAREKAEQKARRIKRDIPTSNTQENTVHDENCECVFCRFNRDMSHTTSIGIAEEAGDARLIRPSIFPRGFEHRDTLSD